MGCGRNTVPLTSETETTSNTDSTTVRDNTERIDSSYVERLIKKLMPGSQVGVSLTPGQYDSLVRALKSLPPGVNTIYKIDPTLQTKLSLALDSLGNLQIFCQTLDRYYFEKDVQSKKEIYRLTQELTKVNNELKESKSEVRIQKPGILENIKGFFKTISGIITIAGILLVLGFITGLLKRKT